MNKPSVIMPILEKKQIMEDALFLIAEKSTDENARSWAIDALERAGYDVSMYRRSLLPSDYDGVDGSEANEYEAEFGDGSYPGSDEASDE
jgi:hypothetical protein